MVMEVARMLPVIKKLTLYLILFFPGGTTSLITGSVSRLISNTKKVMASIVAKA
jgi:hypothetical protein